VTIYTRVIFGLICGLLLACCSGRDDPFDPKIGLPLCAEISTPPPILPGSTSVETIPITITLETATREAVLFHPSGAIHVPVVLFINGGSIDGHRYDWLGHLLASNGYAAVIVQENRSGTTSRIYWPGAMIERLRDPDVASIVDLQRVLLAGHSFGGAIVLCLLDQEACIWTAGEIAFSHGVQGAIVLSSHFQPPDDPQATTPIKSSGVPVMLASGTADAYTDPKEVAATFSRLSGGERFLVRLDGANHFQAADCLEPEVDSYQQDAPARVSHEVALARFGESVLTFLSWKFGSDPHAWGVLERREGIAVMRADE
jgi:pimeloyl-ACP methyl ester carboxylesterase